MNREGVEVEVEKDGGGMDINSSIFREVLAPGTQ